jgi:hypothetical protein
MKEIPPHIKEKIDKLTDELKKVYELAEKSWEGCDGCDENDKNFWIKGFQAGYMQGLEQENLYSKEDVLKAGEIGEINHHDYKHIVSLLDEAKAINQSLKKSQNL